MNNKKRVSFYICIEDLDVIRKMAEKKGFSSANYMHQVLHRFAQLVVKKDMDCPCK